MKTREEALTYGLSFPDTYQDAPFRDANWQLIRVKRSKKVFLWTYERETSLSECKGNAREQRFLAWYL